LEPIGALFYLRPHGNIGQGESLERVGHRQTVSAATLRTLRTKVATKSGSKQSYLLPVKRLLRELSAW